MELIAWCLEEKSGDLFIAAGEKKYRIKEVEALQAMGALITQETDLMSAMQFRMRKVGKALWMDLKFYKNERIAEGRQDKRYREVVQPCILHSCESWCGVSLSVILI